MGQDNRRRLEELVDAIDTPDSDDQSSHRSSGREDASTADTNQSAAGVPSPTASGRRSLNYPSDPQKRLKHVAIDVVVLFVVTAGMHYVIRVGVGAFVALTPIGFSVYRPLIVSGTIVAFLMFAGAILLGRSNA